jgi:hypothetical protein
MRAFAGVLVAVVVVLCATAPALAGPEMLPVEPIELRDEEGAPWRKGVVPEDQLRALEAFKRGNALLKDGLFAQAVEAYREALGHWNHPAIHYNMALALVNLDQPLALLYALEAAMQYGPGPLEQERFDRAKDLRMLVLRQIGQLEVKVPVEGAVLIVDGKELLRGPGTWRGRITAGRHNVAFDHAGSRSHDTIVVVGGETTRHEMALYDEVDRESRRALPRWVPPAIMVVGVAGGAGGLALDAAGDDRAAYALYGVGGALLVTGALVEYLERDQPVRRRFPMITPVAGASAVGIAAAGRF